MSIIDYEIDQLSQQCHHLIQGSKLTTCMKTLIRVEIKHSISRHLTVCLRFSDTYPNNCVLIELKSKTLSSKLLDGLTNLAEQRAKEYLGKAHVIEVLKFISNYMIENPLCIVHSEIIELRKLLINDCGEIKLKQKQKSIWLTAKGGQYYYKIKVFVPDDYPSSSITWNNHDSNLPIVLVRFLNGQAKEIARQCVEAPLRIKQNDQPFEPKPSLMKALGFICKATQDFYLEICPICKKQCLPSNPADIITNDTHDNYIERVFCGHIYHQGCLKKFIREPPFLPGGKLCPAQMRHPRSDAKDENLRQRHNKNFKDKTQSDKCSIRLSHDRWGLSVKLAEARWAQQQARERELEEVKDFLQ